MWLLFSEVKIGDGDDSRLNIPIASTIGLNISILNQNLCDSFLKYGQTASNIATNKHIFSQIDRSFDNSKHFRSDSYLFKTIVKLN